jgi:hypothetical protein
MHSFHQKSLVFTRQHLYGFQPHFSSSPSLSFHLVAFLRMDVMCVSALKCPECILVSAVCLSIVLSKLRECVRGSSFGSACFGERLALVAIVMRRPAAQSPDVPRQININIQMCSSIRLNYYILATPPPTRLRYASGRAHRHKNKTLTCIVWQNRFAQTVYVP